MKMGVTTMKFKATVTRSGGMGRLLRWIGGAALAGAVSTAAMAQGWQPTKSVEFIVPAGTGGGADQMARFVQGLITKHKLMSQPMVVLNKSGGAGAEGFLDAKNARPDGHKIIITLSNVFTTPLATGVPFNWKDLTPVQMLALDEFVLWVNAESPYKTVADYVKAVKAAEDGKFKMGGTGSKQEDQIITVALEKAIGKKMTYIPFKGGGDVAVQLVGKHIDTTVNNPIEAASHWKAGTLRALCVFDHDPMPYPNKITSTQSWKDVPTCRSQGLDVEYLMLRGIFMPPKSTPAQVAYFQDIFNKVRALPEWKEFLEAGAFKDMALSGNEFKDWLTKAEAEHTRLMTEAGFLAKK
jgi:putative tricarboxylic transport membrane protein